ncbi:MAG: cupredoxin domain-containing protein [Chloroflexi bacterium]|nr:cupredoxin domain-containing protein [Chloroflexota bacterium]
MNKLLLFVVITSIMLLSACAPRASNAAHAQLTVEAKDIAFTPINLTTKAGEEVEVTLKNVGALEHDFTIQKISLNGEAHSENTEHDASSMGHMDEEPPVHVVANAGKTASVTFTPSEPGEYEYFCTVTGHKEAGMLGKLQITAP